MKEDLLVMFVGRQIKFDGFGILIVIIVNLNESSTSTA